MVRLMATSCVASRHGSCRSWDLPAIPHPRVPPVKRTRPDQTRRRLVMIRCRQALGSCRHHMNRSLRIFLVRSVAFLSILIGSLGFVEHRLGRRTEKTNGRHVIGKDVYETVRAAKERRPRAESLFFGDSVARQLFHHTAEPSERV